LDCACMELELAHSKDWEYGIRKINPKIDVWNQNLKIHELNVCNPKNNSKIGCMKLEKNKSRE
jgi:hypothetical protein